MVAGLTEDTIDYEGGIGLGSAHSFHIGSFSQYIVSANVSLVKKLGKEFFFFLIFFICWVLLSRGENIF